MAFKKGHQKTGGIKKGQKQQRTLEWEQFGKDLLTLGLPRVMEILQDLEDEKFMYHYEKYLEYFKPKLARTELSGEVQVKTITDTTKFTIKSKV